MPEKMANDKGIQGMVGCSKCEHACSEYEHAYSFIGGFTAVEIVLCDHPAVTNASGEGKVVAKGDMGNMIRPKWCPLAKAQS
jgi:hypothetical protein